MELSCQAIVLGRVSGGGQSTPKLCSRPMAQSKSLGSGSLPVVSISVILSDVPAVPPTLTPPQAGHLASLSPRILARKMGRYIVPGGNGPVLLGGLWKWDWRHF